MAASTAVAALARGRQRQRRSLCGVVVKGEAEREAAKREPDQLTVRAVILSLATPNRRCTTAATEAA